MFKVSHKSKISYYHTSTLMTHRLEKANFVLDWYRGYYVRFTSHLSLRIRRTNSRKVRGSIPRLSTVFFCNSAFDEYCFYLYVYCMYFRFILFASALTRQLFVDIRQIERIVRPLVLGTLFEQVVFAIGVFVVTSVRDVWPVVNRHFRLFT